MTTRILLIHQHDPGTNHVGGIGTFINTFVKYAPEDFDIDLVGVTADPAIHPVGRWGRLKLAGKECDFFPLVAANPFCRQRIPLSLQFTWALRRHRRGFDFENTILEFHRIEPSLALKGLSNPKVLFLHGHMQDLYNPKTEVRWGKFPWLYFWLEQKLVPAMEKIYIVREDAVPFYRQRFPHLADKFSFLPTWVDETVFSSMREEERRLWKERLAREEEFNPKTRLLLFVGRFEGQKDPLLLLESFCQLNGQVGDAVLVMIGAGSLEATIREFIRDRGLASRVRILGPKPQEEIARWMNIADCLCLSSAFEGMPRVVVEALCCGLPVVSSNVGETKRLLPDSSVGRLVSERTPAAFVRAIANLLRQPRNPKACQERVAPFTASGVLRHVYQSYRELGERPQ